MSWLTNKIEKKKWMDLDFWEIDGQRKRPQRFKTIEHWKVRARENRKQKWRIQWDEVHYVSHQGNQGAWKEIYEEAW